MKTKCFFICLAVLFNFGSCSNSINSDEEDAGIPANVDLKIEGVAGAGITRATGALPLENSENVIDHVVVGLFKASDGTTDVISEAVLSSEGSVSIKGTAGLRDIIVVANAPKGTFAGVMTKEDFLKKTLALTQTEITLPMSGETISPVTLTAGTPASLSLSISRLVSRVQMVSLETAFDPVGMYANASFKLDKVFLYNAKGSSTVAAVPVTTNLIHGYDGVNIQELSLLDTLALPAPVTSTPITNPYYFYTFPNDATLATATKLVIGGWFKASPTSDELYVYYPAVINRKQSGTTITGNSANIEGIGRNNIYSVKAVIKRIGVSSPELFMEPSDLDLSITVDSWNLTIQQSVEF